MNNITWAEEYAARFKALSAREIEVWEEILKNEIRNLGSGEISKAVKLLGEEKQQGKYKYAPSVEDLKSAIVKNRWLSSPRRNEPGRQQCALCGGTGWMPFGASYKHSSLGITIGAADHALSGWSYGIFSTPCLCTTGERQINTYRHEDRANIVALSKSVLEFKKSITNESPVEDQLMAVDEG
jgi:hypothetical protein